jgi:hypothetical protein
MADSSLSDDEPLLAEVSGLSGHRSNGTHDLLQSRPICLVVERVTDVDVQACRREQGL